MENTQPTRTASGSASQAATSGASTKSEPKGSMPLGASKNSSETTTATMQNGSPKTWTNAELEVLRLKAGLVAGALADWQTAKGIVVVKEIEYVLPSGSRMTALKIYLVAEGMSLKAVHTADGLDFDLVAVPAESLE